MNRAAIAGQLAAVQVEPGLWEAEVRVLDVEGASIPVAMEQALKQPRPNRLYCITPEQARRPDVLAGHVGRAVGACAVSDFTMRDGRMQGEMQCNSGRPNATSAQMEGGYSPRAFDYLTRMRTDVPAAGGDVLLTIRNRGRWLGPCPEGTRGE
jgi:hypothetical protein